MRRVVRTMIALSLGVALVACALAAGKGNPNPGILPPNAKPHGASYGEWGDRWWQWAYAFPVDTNPVVDPTGAFAAEGQSGRVWFLAGTFGGSADRTITVPAGKGLFFPIVNQIWINIPALGDNPWSPEQEAFARELIAETIDTATGLSCEIDGRPVEDINAYRFQTPEGGAFMVTLPENNVWGIPAGAYGPSVSDGYFLMLAPLSAGHHTIHFAATIGTFSLDVTYHLTVVGGK